ncbi:MAG TPA: hypothetical protein VLA77_00810 [Candidatus Saccharimonadales bacterium]|nr:hypothetical protein [Candidatus Saccharimonadales bacterium]
MRRKIIIFVIVAVVLVAIGFFAYNFFTTEQVNIKSNSQNAKVSIYTLQNQVVDSKNAPYSTRLKPGIYSVVVTDNQKETRSIFTLKQGTPVDLTLDLVDVKSPKKIAPYSSKYIFADENFLNFIRKDVNQLDRLTFGEKYLKELSQGSYSQAYWANADQAILTDTANKSHYYDFGTISPLGYKITNPGTISFLGDSLAYIEQKVVYIRPTITAAPVVEVPVRFLQPQLSLGPNNQFVVFETGVFVDETEGEEGQAQSELSNATPEIYSGNERLQKQSDALKNYVIDGATWSPDGQKLAFSAGDGIYIMDINTSSIRQLYLSYTTHPQSIKWLDEQTLIYFLDQGIWKITLNETPTWNLLAKVEGSLGWSAPLSLSPSKKEIYYSSDELQSSNDAVYQIDL